MHICHLQGYPIFLMIVQGSLNRKWRKKRLIICEQVFIQRIAQIENI